MPPICSETPTPISTDMMADKVTVRVPATTANLGPVYDILGLALDLWLTTTIERADTTPSR
jgi:homoserine kinase